MSLRMSTVLVCANYFGHNVSVADPPAPSLFILLARDAPNRADTPYAVQQKYRVGGRF